MSQRARYVTLRRQRDAPHVHNMHSTQQKFRKIPIQTTPVVSDPMARFPRWPKNVFFASDFIAERDSGAAAATVTAASGSSTNTRHTVTESINRGGAASRQVGGVEASKTDRRINRRYRRRAPGASASERGCEARRPGPSNKRVIRMAQKGVGHESRESSGNMNTIHNSSGTHKMPAATGTKEALFLEESASALLFLHSRFFGGVRRHEDLVCRLCMLCKEAGWMGDSGGVCSGLDPLVLEGLLAERLGAKTRASKTELQGLEHPDRHHRPAAGAFVFSFEDFYQTLADVASFVYPHEANEGGARSGRALHRLLKEGVLPLANDSKTRVWSTRPEVLYGRPALIALRSQQDSLHQLYRSYSNNDRSRTGVTGFNRQTFLKMLRDLGASPGSVSDERAKAVFDAVLRNGLPETQSGRVGRSHQVMTNVWMAGESNGNPIERKGRKGVSDEVSISRGGRLCWSLFLEAMAALAVEAVEDRHRTMKRNDDHTINRSATAACSQSRHSDANGGDHHLRKPGNTGDKEDKEYLSRCEGSRVSTRRIMCGPTGSMRCGDEERTKTIEVNGTKNGPEKCGYKPNMERNLAASTGLHATTGLSSKTDGQLRWRGSCEFDHTTRKMKLMPTLPESHELQDQEGMPVRHRFSPGRNVAQQCGFGGKPTSLVSQVSQTACSRPKVTDFTVNNATAASKPLADDKLAVAPKGGPQTQCVKSLLDEAHVKKRPTTHTTPRDDEQKQCTASPDQVFPPPLHTGGLENVPFGDRGAHVTGLRAAECQGTSMEEKCNVKALMQVSEGHADADGLLIAAAPQKCNSSDETLISKSVHQRSIGKRDQAETIIISDQNQLHPGVTASQEGAIKREHPLCAANGVGGDGCGASRESDDPETSTRPQSTLVRSRVHNAYLPLAGEYPPFSIADGRAQNIEDDLRTPAPCHGSSTPVLAYNGKPGVKSARQQEVAVKLFSSVVAPQGGNMSGLTSAADAGSRAHPTSSLLSASGISHTGSGPNSSSALCEAALNCFAHFTEKKCFEERTLTEVARAKDDESGCAIANTSCPQAPLHPGTSTIDRHSVAATRNTNTGDSSVEVSSARPLKTCKHHGSRIGSEEIRTQGLREDLRSCGISDEGRDGRKEINQQEKCRGRDDSEKKHGGGRDQGLHADRTIDAINRDTVGAADVTVGAAGCIPAMTFEELLDPKVVAVYSRHRAQLTRLFRRYSTGPNDADGCTTPRNPEGIGCVQDKGMKQFVNDFPSLREWAQGGDVQLELQLIVSASSDRGWRRLKGTKRDPAIDMPPGGASGLCYLGFLEVLTRMAHAVRGDSPTHQKLLAMMRSLQADEDT